MDHLVSALDPAGPSNDTSHSASAEWRAHGIALLVLLALGVALTWEIWTDQGFLAGLGRVIVTLAFFAYATVTSLLMWPLARVRGGWLGVHASSLALIGALLYWGHEEELDHRREMEIQEETERRQADAAARQLHENEDAERLARSEEARAHEARLAAVRTSLHAQEFRLAQEGTDLLAVVVLKNEGREAIELVNVRMQGSASDNHVFLSQASSSDEPLAAGETRNVILEGWTIPSRPVKKLSWKLEVGFRAHDHELGFALLDGCADMAEVRADGDVCSALTAPTIARFRDISSLTKH